ncbi:MAG: hypothetical protein IH586_11920 [Anaerolineaceae bacterium]|nr:hypothetical protein [Anaerolineaceae bacterium]
MIAQFGSVNEKAKMGTFVHGLRDSFSIFSRERSMKMGIQAVLLILTLIALLPSIPALYKTPDIDSGIYSYIGWRILDGQIPYRDIWDHKPPLIYFLNAAGLAVGGAGRWGIWMLEVLSIWAACRMLFSFLNRYFESLPAFFALAGFLGNLFFVLEFGNIPEEFGLPLQTAIYLLLADLLRIQSTQDSPFANKRKALLLGVLLGLAISLKQTLIGAGLVVVICLIVSAFGSKKFQRLYSVAWIGLGFLLVWGGWVVYFAINHSLGAFWDQAFRYNFFYSSVTNPDRIHAVLDVVKNLNFKSGFFLFGFLTWLTAFVFLFLNEQHFRESLVSRWIGFFGLALGSLVLLNGLIDDRTGRLFAIGSLSPYRQILVISAIILFVLSFIFISGWVSRQFIKVFAKSAAKTNPGLMVPLGILLLDLPVQLVLSGLSGRNYYHYFIPILPSLTIAIAFIVWSLVNNRDNFRFLKMAYVWLGILSIPILGMGWHTTLAAIHPQEVSRVRQAVDYIRQNSGSEERLLQWGMEGRLNFLSGRATASTFLYQRALFSPGYSNSEKISLFLSDLQNNPPVIIIDTRKQETPFILNNFQNCTRLSESQYINQEMRAEWDARFPLAKDDPLPYYRPEIGLVYRWVCENYEQVSPEQDLGAWRVFKLRGGS